jgi:uncharacterized protein with HEPN domain
MTNEAIITEIQSIVDYIEETKSRVILENDKFQVALTNTLRLLGDTNPTLARLKGDTEKLKGYLIKTSTEMRETAIQPYHHLKTKLEKVLRLLQAS